MVKGDIFRMVNIFIILRGSILIRSKSDKSIIGRLGAGTMLSHEKYLSKNDP